MRHNYRTSGALLGMVRLNADEAKLLERLLEREKNVTHSLTEVNLAAQREGLWLQRIRTLEERVVELRAKQDDGDPMRRVGQRRVQCAHRRDWSTRKTRAPYDKNRYGRRELPDDRRKASS